MRISEGLRKSTLGRSWGSGILVAAWLLGCVPGAWGQSDFLAKLNLPAAFELDLSRLNRSFSAPHGMARPTERRPERALLGCRDSSFSARWEVVEYPRNGNFGYSVDTWGYRLEGQWDAGGKVSGQSVMTLRRVLHNNGQSPYETSTRYEKYELGGQIEPEGRLRLRFRLVEAKWTWMGRPTRVPELSPWEMLFDLPVRRGEESLALTLKTDKETYEIGEPVGMSFVLEKVLRVKDAEGQVLSEQRQPVDDALFELAFTFPPSRVAGPLSGVIAESSDCRKFVPYAPILAGKYTVEVKLRGPQQYKKLIPEEGLGGGSGPKDVASLSFECTPPGPESRASLQRRMDEVIARYRAEVPEHRDPVLKEYLRRYALRRSALRDRTMESPGHTVVIPPEKAWPLNDMEYGPCNNEYFGTSWACGDYQTRVLDFLNRLHFNGGDRRLMVGIYYGPIQRGIPSNNAADLTGEHHGVVLYPHFGAFDDDGNTVLDPWPKQRPEVFKLSEFRWFYSVWHAVSTPAGVFPDLGNDPPIHVFEQGSISGYPTHGGTVFWNHGWKRAPAEGMARGTVTQGSPATPPDESARPEPPRRGTAGVGIAPPQDYLYLTLRCPAWLTVADSQGRRIGLTEGRLACEIPHGRVSVFEKARGDWSWYVAVPVADYSVTVEGQSKGSFDLSVSQGRGVVRSYLASLDARGVARLSLSNNRPDAPLLLPDGSRVSPVATDEAKRTAVDADSAASRPPVIPAAKLKALRETAAAACEMPAGLPEGWSKSPVDPHRLVAVFAPLSVRKGFALRAYVFREDTNGNGVVWAMPENAEFPQPKDCPSLENHLLKAPKPSEALGDAMDAIEGDGSPYAYLAASLLRRQLAEFGAAGHGVLWGLHQVLYEDPWKAGPTADGEPPLDRPSGDRSQWTVSGELPQDWSPRVKVEGDRVIVTFSTYCGLEKQRIVRHTDTYRAGNYRPKVEQQTIAEGPPGFMP